MIEHIREVTTVTPAEYDLPTETVMVRGDDMTLEDVVAVARKRVPVALTEESSIVERVVAAATCIEEAACSGMPVYGVTSGFGGMADVIITPEDAAELQNNIIWYHKTGAGDNLPVEDVRASMLLRANTLMKGVSGARLELIQRIVDFLNADVTPRVPELGSIGASGDLVPLTYIAGSLIGLDPCFTVDYEGEVLPSTEVLERLGLRRMNMQPKEGLAMINGTSVMTGVAANCVYDMRSLLALTLGAHALSLQAMYGTNQSFHPFIHQCKPHLGQIRAAEQMLTLLEGSKMSRDELDGSHEYRDGDLIQDRYSMRCLAQYIGPAIEGLWEITRKVETEINSATDNPLIDVQHHATYHGGNFLGEYIGVAMDQLRYYIGLLAKHLDAQISLMIAPCFNNGLAASLVGNEARRVNMGFKGLQIAANSIMPLLLFYGNSITDRYPTHAEQFNQNVNSQGFNSANLAHRSVDIFRDYVAMALMFGVQAVDLRTKLMVGHYDARALLSPLTARLYEALREAVDAPISETRPYVWNDPDQPLDAHIERISANIRECGEIPATMTELMAEMSRQAPIACRVPGD